MAAKSETGGSSSAVSFKKINLAFRQFPTLLRRNTELFINDRTKILITVLLPLLIGALIYKVSDVDEVGSIFESTKTTLFTIVSACIYVGMFNSLTLICKERAIIKREYMTNLSISSYICSNVLFQMAICFLQAVLFMIPYWALPGIFSPEAKAGLLEQDRMIGFKLLMILFLILLVSDLMGMLISCIARKNESANLAAPILLIIQLVMSGVLFKIGGAMKWIGSITVSKWGMCALGAVINMNGLEKSMKGDIGSTADWNQIAGLSSYISDQAIPDEEDALAYAADALSFDVEMMLLFCVIIIILCIIILRRVEKDSR